MKSKFSKITSLLLVLVMMTTLLPGCSQNKTDASSETESSAAEEASSSETAESTVFEYETLDDGTLAITKYTGTEKSTEVPGSIDGTPVTQIAESAFAGNTTLEKIDISENITEIGDYAFECCSSLKKIYLPESLTTLGKAVFSGCNHLKLCDIQDNLTTIGDAAFLYCVSLESIYIPASLTDIGKFAFAGCSGLLGIDLRETAVTDLKVRTFFDCSKLVNVLLPMNLETIDEKAFYNCSQLSEIIIPDSVRTIGLEAFCGDTALQQISLSVEEIGEAAFKSCYGLQSVYISENIKKIGAEAFADAPITEEDAYLPDGVEVDATAFGEAQESGDSQDSASADTGEASAAADASEESSEVEAGITPISIDDLVAQCEDDGYRCISNDEFDSWAEEYVEFNSANIIPDSDYNFYVAMYKGEVIPYFQPMGAAMLYYEGIENKKKDTEAKGIVGTNYEEMFIIADHGLATEISRTQIDDDLVLFSGLSSNQLLVAGGTDELPTTEQLQARIGSEFTDPIMISTTTDPEIARTFGDTMFVIEASAEAMNKLGAICMDAYTHSNEKEILMNQYAHYKILDVGYAQYKTTGDDGEEEIINERYVKVELLVD